MSWSHDDRDESFQTRRNIILSIDKITQVPLREARARVATTSYSGGLWPRHCRCVSRPLQLRLSSSSGRLVFSSSSSSNFAVYQCILEASRIKYKSWVANNRLFKCPDRGWWSHPRSVMISLGSFGSIG